MDAQDFTGFGIFGQKGWKWEPLLTRTEREENWGRDGLCSPRREEEGHEVAGAQSETVAAGGGRSPERGEIARHRERQRWQGEEVSLWLGRGLEAFF
jgi:hypothetical protein